MKAAKEIAADAFASSQGMFGYENLSDSNPRRASERAEMVLADGWSHRGKYRPHPILAPIPWSTLDPQETSLNFHLHCLDPVHDLLAGHSATGEPRFFDAALQFAMDWTLGHDGESGDPDGFAWYDMAVGVRAYRLAYILDFADRSGVDKATCRRLWQMLLRHAAYLDDDANIAFQNNHGLYQVAGQLAMGRRFANNDPEMARARKKGEVRLAAMIRSQFTDEGVHKEHSPDYHRMVYDTLKGLLAAGLVSEPGISEMCSRIETSLAWFVAPDGTLANFGDTDIRNMLSKGSEAGRRWHFDAMRFTASSGELGAAPRETWRAFQASGYFMARDAWPGVGGEGSGGSYLAQIAAFHSRTHKHADDLSFVWFEGARPILVDAGRYGYFGKTEPGSALHEGGNWYSDPNRVYVESTRAHNTVEIDGKDTSRTVPRPYGSAIRAYGAASGGAVYCETEIMHGDSVRHGRVLVYKPGSWLLVYDRLKDMQGHPHDFQQWFHFSPELSLEPSGLGLHCERPGFGSLSVLSLIGSPSAHVERGVTHPRMQGYFSPRERTLVENDAVAFTQAGRAEANFATLLVLGEPGARPRQATAELRGSRLDVEFDDGRHRHRIGIADTGPGGLHVACASQTLPDDPKRICSPCS